MRPVFFRAKQYETIWWQPIEREEQIESFNLTVIYVDKK